MRSRDEGQVLDRWMRRLALGVVVGVSSGLLGLGLYLYRPSTAAASTPSVEQELFNPDLYRPEGAVKP